MKITFSSITNKGPRQVNEDAIDCWVSDKEATVACVADGLGGMGGGDIASKLAIREFKKYLTEFGINPRNLTEAAHKAHREIRKAQTANEANSRASMATTLTAVAISAESLVGVHCGDSRAAIARNSGIKKLTSDHSEGQRLFSSGKLTKKELANYERKHILESALGGKEEPQIDHFAFQLLPGDHILLTSDGVHNIIPLREMQRISVVSKSPAVLTQKISALIDQIGATDNYSMIALYAG